MNNIKSIVTEKIFFLTGLLVTIVCMIFYMSIIKTMGNIEGMYPRAAVHLNSLLHICIMFVVAILILGIGFVLIVRRELVKFTDELNVILNKMIKKDTNIHFNVVNETLMSKIQSKLKQLIEMINSQHNQYVKEKVSIKSLISDISHQIKTPLANLSIYNSTLLERDHLTKEQENEFLNNMQSQIKRIDWLIKALIKMSRLETDIITLNSTRCPLEDTIAEAVSNIYVKAEKKDIGIAVKCKDINIIEHDKKWIAEALFNILDNAVKYTHRGGQILVKVVNGEMFTKINIEDNGIGIESDQINNIFKRFYRSTEVSEIEGVGLGLYIVREIIRKQGGYIKVTSQKGVGSTFSVYLPNDTM
ncbi:sensor histidine kinase [Abyssisolibacter fermentans]|uniref:sensor histidine kinase n=1 Tax=Abyssisolibacter fermentans TaxID=1766203 RepID=UPI00082E5368|nr:HAMP domain-containing sensor histidine kinase [Abyssisolibacter fermentans]